VLELAKSVEVSADGLVHTFKLRDDALFHNGRKMVADDIIWTFTRLMDGSKSYPAARYVRLLKGAIDVEKGQAKEISGLKKIDDFTLEMTFTERTSPASSSTPRRPRSTPPRRPRPPTSSTSRSDSARSNSSSMYPARAWSSSAGRSSTSPASPMPTSW
jgi:hypothetical protein